MNSEGLSSRISLHLPLTLLSLAAAIFLATQLSAVNHNARTIEWQRANLGKQSANVNEAQKQLAEAITKRDELVQQSTQVQQRYKALFTEVLDLAKTDPDAARIVTKYGIQINNLPADSAAGAPAKPPEAK